MDDSLSITFNNNWGYYANYLIPVVANTTYYFKASGVDVNNLRASIYLVDSKYEIIKVVQNSIQNTISNYTINTIGDTKYICISFCSNLAKTIVIKDIILSQDNISYIPHKGSTHQLRLGNIHLRSIGDYKDKINKENGKWYLEQNVNQVTLNGSETWNEHSNTNENYLCAYRNLTDMATGINILTNMFMRGNHIGSQNCVYNSYQKNFVV